MGSDAPPHRFDATLREREPDAEVEAESLLDACRAELARYKVPEQILFVETLPRNAMSKVVKRELLPLFGVTDS